MGLDHIVDLRCPAKEALGDGDHHRGTRDILERKKARRYAAMLAETAEEEGGAPGELSVTLAVHRDGETEEREVSYDELLAQAAPLDQHAGGCEECAANVLGQPYGCMGSVGYPIPAAAEEWLMARVQGADPAAQELLGKAIDDFEYDGAPLVAYREQGVLEGEAPVSVEIQGRTVTSDQLLQALVAVGPEIEPAHAFMLCLFVGGVTADDEHAEDFDIGEQPDDLGALELYALFHALAAAVAEDVPLLVDA